MNKKLSKKSKLLIGMGDHFKPDDLVPIAYKRNGCLYRWGIPYKNYPDFLDLAKPYFQKELLDLEAKLLDILILRDYSIDFKSPTSGVKKLSVIIRSSESNDRQLLYKLSTGLSVKKPPFNKDSLPGTNNNDER